MTSADVVGPGGRLGPPDSAGTTTTFTTAFHRDKGMLWKFDHAGYANVQWAPIAVWSRDLQMFDWSWPAMNNGGTGVSAWDALAPSLGNTSHMAGAVPALLLADANLRYVRLWPGRLTGIADAGDEAVDGVMCFMVDAGGWMKRDVRLWIDPSGALRKFRAVFVAPPFFDVPERASTAVVTYRPEFDVEIADLELQPSADLVSVPAK